MEAESYRKRLNAKAYSKKRSKLFLASEKGPRKPPSVFSDSQQSLCLSDVQLAITTALSSSPILTQKPAMSRRAAPGGPLFATQPQRRVVHDPNESAFSRFLREEIFSPENLPGNVNILTSVAVFFGGIAAMRTWGELMIPA